MTYPYRTLSYGASPDQVGDLYLPAGGGHGSVICLVHGGFWRVPYGREHIARVAPDLVARGFAVWNLEYRRVGQPGGGWPGTLDDVGRGIDHLATLAAAGEPFDVRNVTIVGHSAGGHLALWSGQRDCTHTAGLGPRHVAVRRVAGLAPLADLAVAYERGCGNGAVENFLGGSPAQVEARYRSASPIELLPLRCAQLLIHGTHDEIVPIELSRRYTAAARAAGDSVQLIEMQGGGHFEFVDPSSREHAALCGWLTT